MKIKFLKVVSTAFATMICSTSFATQGDHEIIFSLEKAPRIKSMSNIQLMSVASDVVDTSKLGLTPVRTILGKYVVATVNSARIDSDVQAAVNRLRSTPGVRTAQAMPKYTLHALNSTSFNDPGWEDQFSLYSGIGEQQTNKMRSYDTEVVKVMERFTDRSSNVIIGMVDSGWTNRSEFSGRIMNQYDFLERDEVTGDPGPSALEDDAECDSIFRHGSAVLSVMAGTRNNSEGVAGILPNARFHVARFINDCFVSGSGPMEAVIAMADLPEDERPQVINMSLGSIPIDTDGDGFGDTYPECTPFEQDSLNYAMERGIIVVASSGNDGFGNKIAAPASCDGVISVGATDTSGDYTNYSSLSNGLDISTFGGANFEGTPVFDGRPDRQLTTVTGTSFAAPLVSAILALAKEAQPNMTSVELLQKLQNTAASGTSQNDERCVGSTCFRMKAVAFLQSVDPVAFAIAEDPDAGGGETGGGETGGNTDGNVSVPVEVGNLGYDEICSLSSDNSAVSITLSGAFEKCSSVQTTGIRYSLTANQIVTFSGPEGARFNLQISGFSLDSPSQQTTVTQQYQLNNNNVQSVQEAQQPTSPPSNGGGAGGGGGGALNLFGLLAMFGLLISLKLTVRNSRVDEV